MDLFLIKIQQEWKDEIQPMIDSVCDCVTSIITDSKMDPSNLFLKCYPVDIYTKIYKLTVHPHVDFIHLDFMYKKELASICYFCSQFHITHLDEIPQHIKGFQVLIKWFQCFFHHLNRIQNKVYSISSNVEKDMISTIQNIYIHKQKDIISNLLVGKWSLIRKNDYFKDVTLLEVMKIISFMDPLYYREILTLYHLHFQKYLSEKSTEWLSLNDYLSFMKYTKQCFQQEKQMFSYYFPLHEKHDLENHDLLLKKKLVYPYYELFISDQQYGWKYMLQNPKSCDLQTAYFFYSNYYDYTLWILLYQEFLKETIQTFPEDKKIGLLSSFLKRQHEFLKTFFLNEKIQNQFITILEKEIFDIFTKNHHHLVIQLVKNIHQIIHKKSSYYFLHDLTELIQFCPDKDFFYKHYRQSMKERLLMDRFHIENERDILEKIQTKLGMSFVLNLKLMLEEIQYNCLSENQFFLYKLSKVVWEKRDYVLQYSLPYVVQKNLQSLYDLWRKKTDPMIRLEKDWLQGSVILSFQKTDYIMTPIQAIVLLALEDPVTHRELVNKLNIPDDHYHNLEGILESLSKIMLIKKNKKEQWVWDTSKKHKTKIYVPNVKQPKKNLNQHEETKNDWFFIVVEAWIIRKMKQEKKMSWVLLWGDLQQQFQEISIKIFKTMIENLIDREFLIKNVDQLIYIP